VAYFSELSWNLPRNTE